MKKITIISMAMLLIVSTIFSNVPNFELWNKTGSEINVKISFQLINDTGRKRIERKIFPGDKYEFYNIKNTAGLTITLNETNVYLIMPCFEQDCFKTIYLSYDKTGLRPQKGPWLGLKGITDSGYDNTNNITPNFIRKSSLVP